MSTPSATRWDPTGITRAGLAPPPWQGLGPDTAELLNTQVLLLIFSLMLLMVIVKLPHLFARLQAEWSSGHILRKVANPAGRLDKANYWGDMHSQAMHESLPPHVAAVPRLLRFLLPYLRARVSPGFSVAQMTVLTIYLALLLFATFFRSSGPFSDFHSLGWVATAQIPLVFAFGVKNSIIASLLGKGYERLNYLHRFLGRAVVIVVNLHSFGYIYRWCELRIFQEKGSDTRAIWGITGLIAMNGLFLLSTEYMRKNFYRLFLFSHIACVLILFPACWIHWPGIIPWISTCIGIYGLDRILRIVKTRITTANLIPLPHLGMTRLECGDINAGWRAGQHVRIRVLSSGMGLIGCTEVHPFTIGSSADGQGLTLYCKSVGPWTRNLYKIANDHRGLESRSAKVRVMIEGPYGGPSNVMFSSFTGALFVVGGSGVSFALGAIEEIMHKTSRGESRVQMIDMVWMTQDASTMNGLVPQLTSMMSQCTIPLKVSVHYTRASKAGKVETPQYLPPSLTLHPGRADIVDHLQTLAVQSNALGMKARVNAASGMVVCVCGPTGLSDSVAKDVGLVDPQLRDRIGGIELFEESFSW